MRPETWDDFIGQEHAVGLLRLKIAAALNDDRKLDHLLLLGPAGLGKTSLAKLAAAALGGRFLDTACKALDSPNELHKVVLSLQEGDILFIDEIHRLNSACQEVLFRAMEDGETSITVGEGDRARIVPVKLPAFTLIGATNMGGQMTPAFRRRFLHQLHLDYYTVPELQQIVCGKLQRLSLTADMPSVDLLAQVSRGEAHTAERLVIQLRDFARARGESHLDFETVRRALRLLGVHAQGLDKLQVSFMRALYQRESLSLATLAHMLGEDAGVIEQVVEPYLMRLGFIDRTSRGRSLTDDGHSYVARLVAEVAA